MKLQRMLAASAALATLGLVAAGPVPAQDRPDFSYVVKDMTNPYYWRMGEGARRAAKDLGVNLDWTSAQFNGDIEGQISVVESELVKSPDALILVPMNGTALIPKIMEAQSLGIPVITADTRADESVVDVATFVGLDEKSSFMKMAEWVVGQLDGQGEIAILEGFRGSSTAELRLEGMTEVFAAHDGIEIVASIAADWDREKGLKATEDILQAHPGVDAIIGSNDQMALGAVQAVKSAGIDMDDIIIVGDDAIPSALSALKAGELDATIDGNTDEVGYQAVRAAHDLVVNGRELPEWIKVDSSLILPGDVTDAYLDRRGIELE